MADHSTPRRSRWRTWLPPIIMALGVLLALLLLGPDKSGPIFRYRLF